MSSSYCTRDDIETIYGEDNVAVFANLDKTSSAGTVTARIASWIAEASEAMEEMGRPLGFQIPFVTDAGTVPESIVKMTARLAGIIGYEAFGLDGFSPEGKPNHKYWYQRQQVRQFWRDIENGSRVLVALKG